MQSAPSAAAQPGIRFPVRHIPRALALSLAVLVGLVLLFIGLQAWVLSATHDKRLIKTILSAADSGVLRQENWPVSIYGHGNLDNDMYTECIALSTNLGNEKTASIIERVASTPYHSFIRGDIQAPCRWMIDDMKSGTLTPDQPYFRYWHGHQVYFRPLLANTSLANVRKITALLLFSSLAYMVVMMARRFGWPVIPALVIPIVMGTNVLTVPESSVHALSWAWAFFSVGLATQWFEKRAVGEPATIALVFGLGCVANFFDILFSPPFAPVLMAFVAAAVGMERHRPLRASFDAAVLGFFWFLGFSLCWASKWLFAAAVLGWETVKPSVFGAITYRMYGDPSLDPAKDRLLAATEVCFQISNLNVMAVSGAAALILVAWAVWRARADWKDLLGRFVLLLTPLLAIIVWVEVLRDHSLGHPYFAYRSFVLFSIIPLLAAITFWPFKRAAATAR